MPTTFTLTQAQELVPWLQKTFDTIQQLRVSLADSGQEVYWKSMQMRSNGVEKAEEEMSQAQKVSQAVEHEFSQLVASIVERGILIKDVERGLFDFPFMKDGNLVYLCWVAGEPELRYWHTVDSGFAGRQPL